MSHAQTGWQTDSESLLSAGRMTDWMYTATAAQRGYKNVGFQRARGSREGFPIWSVKSSSLSAWLIPKSSFTPRHKEADQHDFFPSLPDALKIAAAGEYNVLPVSCEILSDFITPIETMRILKNISTHCYLLESAQANETWGRYTFLGYDPKMEITCIDGGTVTGVGPEASRTDDPSDFFGSSCPEYKSPRFDYLPSFTGGLVGYFSYDYLGYSEPRVRTCVEDTENFKDVDLMLFDKVIAFDNIRQKIILIANMKLDDPERTTTGPCWTSSRCRICSARRREERSRAESCGER